jgi:hypothetical protein
MNVHYSLGLITAFVLSIIDQLIIGLADNKSLALIICIVINVVILTGSVALSKSWEK